MARPIDIRASLKCYRKSARSITTRGVQNMSKTSSRLWNMCQGQACSKQCSYTWITKFAWRGPRPRRCHADRLTPNFTYHWWIPNSNDGHWCFFEILIWLPTNWGDSRQCGQGDIMTKHFYLPTTLITDKESAFTSTIVVIQILGITLKCATTKHPQTIGKLERTHAFPQN